MSRQSAHEGADARQPADLHRRTFLKAASAAAALGSGIGLLGGGADGQRAAAAVNRGAAAVTPGADQAAGAQASSSVPVLLGGAAVRPPEVPLAVRSPYLSTWLPAIDLTSATPQFWYGSSRGFAGLVRVDGQVYAWAGQPEVSGAAATALTQTSLNVTATRSVFTLSGAGVELTAEWLSPIEPGDLRRESVPFALLTVQARAIDGASHRVQVYADITGEWASSDESDVITWDAVTTGRNRYWSIQLQDPTPLTEDTQMANWGSAIWGSPITAGQTWQSGYAADVRDRFASAGSLADSSDTGYRAVDDDQPVFAFASDLGTVTGGRSQPVSFAIGHVRTPLISYGPDATPILPWWTTYWQDWTQVADFFLADAAAARTRAAALDARIQGAATYAAGPGYSAICALAARQCYGGMEVAIGPQGTPWVLGKEISSDGDVNTVDIFDQAYLMWLWLDPEFIPLEMEPILTWCASPGWQDDSLWAGIPSWEDSQTKYCVHDIGVYPVGAGRAPGVGGQMPIEESAAMLIMAASYARKVGAEVARPFLRRWNLLWTQWAQYLLTQVPTPATQLTTDDWVSSVYVTPTGGTNLGIKAIIGLAAAGQIARILGDDANAETWSKAAADNVAPWVTLSLDPSGKYLNIEQGASGTWTTVYNAFYEDVIGEKLVPEDIKALQSSFYLTQLDRYGLGIQTGNTNQSKVAWNLYIPAWLRDYPIAAEMLSRDVAYVNDTPTIVPYGDRFLVTTGVDEGPKAHPSIGGVFAVLLAAEPPVVTTASPGSLVVSAAQAGPVTLTSTSTSREPVTVDWAATPPADSGITVSPASGSVSLAPGRTARVTLTITASAAAAPATITVPVTVTAQAGSVTLASPGCYLQVSVPYPSLAGAFDNVGITDNADHTPGNFDGSRNSFSAQALADAGITAGGQVTAAGVAFTWPDVPSGQQDNVVASGQAVELSGSGSTLGFLGAADNGLAWGSGTITYTDGSTQTYEIGFQNWITATPIDGTVLVATTSYFNRNTTGAARTPSLFAATVPLHAGKTVAFVTLPNVSATAVAKTTLSMHVFALALG